MQHCGVCDRDLTNLQLFSGVTTSDGTYVEGHYACVVAALGPAEVLKAATQGRLPLYDVAKLEDGAVPGLRRAMETLALDVAIVAPVVAQQGA